ncbi:DUF4440 domain-containing protein [Tsukamurella sp. PLM1]|uniref:nuclear transport factor 2 family protein n=1 Tax=Tsukamurella sp. PLM1 TaxID=2929795 RepID=UPI00204E4BEF|nr:DUF4440 domain-containing protein [Tsukamurella sp. PLM1]BDH58852.1 hypothetical protein MTP03_37910 [Tsukamurella sp. PLM1]
MSKWDPSDLPVEREPDRTTARELREVLADLRRREPVFHGPEWTTREAFLAGTAPDFWEVGASGCRYSRDYVWSVIERRQQDPQDDESEWETSDFQVRAMGASVYLLTYTLTQGDRITRRLTVWRRRENHWSVMFHQGTMVGE